MPYTDIQILHALLYIYVGLLTHKHVKASCGNSGILWGYWMPHMLETHFRTSFLEDVSVDERIVCWTSSADMVRCHTKGPGFESHTGHFLKGLFQCLTACPPKINCVPVQQYSLQ